MKSTVHLMNSGTALLEKFFALPEVAGGGAINLRQAFSAAGGGLAGEFYIPHQGDRGFPVEF